jgi:tetratricopeptide (TPR) repeat protein
MSSQDPTLGDAAEASQPSPSTDAMAPGDRIGRYLVIGKLGAGGMGVVYSAYDPELDRKVAIKLLHDSTSERPGAGPGPDMHRARGKVMHALFGDEPPSTGPGASPPLGAGQQRLLREAQAAARVNDPAVVTVHDVGQHRGRVFVAMEFVQGRTLSAWSRERDRGWREVIDVMTRAGSGLVAAHAAGLIHRDFKPDNVMLGDDGRVRVMDFGLVRADASEVSDSGELRPTTDALALELTAGGTTMGTPAYMSPEQHRGKVLDARTDQFSFCIALWEALYGERPFGGGSIASVAAAIMQGNRRPPTDRDVPRAIHAILVRGLETDPDKRWPSMRELVDALRRDPLRLRRRAVAGIAVLAVVGGGLAFQRAQHASAVAGCRTDAQAIASVWNDETRRDLTKHIVDTRVTYAATSSETIARRLDEHAAQWSSLLEAVCVASVDGDTLAYPADARACLDERRGDLEGAITALGSVDATSVRGAVAIATSLVSPDECVDASAAALRAIQHGDRSSDSLAAARGTIRAARRESMLRRFDAAANTLAPLLDETSAPIVVAWAKLALGEVEERRGDYAKAQTLLVDAAFEAEAAGDEASVVQAASALVWVIGYRRGKPADAEYWIRWGRVLADRLGVAESLPGAVLLERLGMVEASRQAYDDALAHLQHALDIKRAELGPDHPEVALALNSLGNVQIQREGPAAAQPIWEEALGILERALGDTHPDLGVVLANLAQVQYRLGDIDASRRLLERAIAIQRAELGANHPEVAKQLVNLGMILQTKGDYAASKRVLLEAKAALLATHGPAHRSLGALAQQLGKVEIASGNLDAGIAILEEGLAILEQVLGPTDVDIAVGLSALGGAHEKRGDLELAQRYYERALVICREHGPDGHPVYLPIALYQLGNLHRVRGNLELAVEHLEPAFARLDATQPKSAETADAGFALARALWDSPTTRARADALVARAREAYVAHDAKAKLGVLDAWLAEHAG